MASLVKRVYQLNERHHDMLGFGDQQSLGKPASELSIRAFEKAIGFALPSSYRTFLSLHDGWTHWASGEAHLFSISQMTEGPYKDSVEEAKRDLSEHNFDILNNGLVISSPLHKISGLILCFDKVDDRGEMPIVLWEYEEIERYSDFYDLLRRHARFLESAIEKKHI